MATAQGFDSPRRVSALPAAGTPLTLSGNEITDARRLESLGINVVGHSYDGRLNDSSYGVWDASTNLLKNGGAETNLTSVSSLNGSAGIVQTRDTTVSKFGTCSIKAVLDGTSANGPYWHAGAGPGLNRFAVSASTPYTFSVWAKGNVGSEPCRVLISWYDAAGVSISSVTVNVDLTTDFALYSVTATSPANAAFALGCFSARSLTAMTFWCDGAQAEQKRIATPYIHTDGATQSRGGARVRMPSSVLNETQAWIAFRVRPGWDQNAEPGGGSGFERMFNWDDGTSNNRVTLFYRESANQFAMSRRSGAAETLQQSTTVSWTKGTPFTAIAAWTATANRFSFNGAAFVQQVGAPTIPNLSAVTLFDIGENAGTGEWFNAEFLWVACGKGTLTDADAAALAALTRDPVDNDFPGAALLTAIWPADTAAVAPSPLAGSFDKASAAASRFDSPSPVLA